MFRRLLIYGFTRRVALPDLHPGGTKQTQRAAFELFQCSEKSRFDLLSVKKQIYCLFFPLVIKLTFDKTLQVTFTRAYLKGWECRVWDK